MKKILFLSLALFAFTDYAVASDEKPSVTQEEVKSEPKIKVLPFVERPFNDPDEIHVYNNERILHVTECYGPKFLVANTNPIRAEIDNSLHSLYFAFIYLKNKFYLGDPLILTVDDIWHTFYDIHHTKTMHPSINFDEEKKDPMFKDVLQLFDQHTKEIDKIAKKYTGDEYKAYREELAPSYSPLREFGEYINTRCNQSKISEISDVFKEIDQILSAWDIITCPSLDDAYDLIGSFNSTSTFFLKPLEYKASDVFYELRNDDAFVRYFTPINRLIGTSIELNKTEGVSAHSRVYQADKKQLWRDVNKLLECFEYCAQSVSNDSISIYKAVSILMDNYHGEGELAFKYKEILYPHIRGLVMLINAMAVALAVTYSHNDMDLSQLSIDKDTLD